VPYIELSRIYAAKGLGQGEAELKRMIQAAGSTIDAPVASREPASGEGRHLGCEHDEVAWTSRWNHGLPGRRSRGRGLRRSRGMTTSSERGQEVVFRGQCVGVLRAAAERGRRG